MITQADIITNDTPEKVLFEGENVRFTSSSLIYYGRDYSLSSVADVRISKQRSHGLAVLFAGLLLLGLGVCYPNVTGIFVGLGITTAALYLLHKETSGKTYCFQIEFLSGRVMSFILKDPEDCLALLTLIHEHTGLPVTFPSTA